MKLIMLAVGITIGQIIAIMYFNFDIGFAIGTAFGSWFVALAGLKK